MPDWVAKEFLEYGILGLVILGLLYLIRFGFIKFETVVNTFSEDFKEIQKEHREDRKQWHEAAERKTEMDRLNQNKREESQERTYTALSSSLDGLKEAIKESNNRSRKYEN
jgi:Sec-independent protein translocase protein TatA